MVVFNADNDSVMEHEILETVVSLRVGGVLCVGGNRDQTNLVNFHSKNDLPIVLVDREVHGYEDTGQSISTTIVEAFPPQIFSSPLAID